jgi:hypothetical protein
MLADRQTTGGYTKIAVVASCDIGLLAQRMPGEVVRFKAVSFEDALDGAREERARLRALAVARAEYRSTPRSVAVPEAKLEGKRFFRIIVDGVSRDVEVEELE